MTLPASATKVYLDAATDDPKQARPELADLVDKFNALLTHLNLSTITSGPAAIPLSVANGGTGASTEAGARTNLGVADATETQAGRIEIATQTEANNGTDDTRALTPAKLASISPASVTFAASDQVLILDASDSNKLKRATITAGKVLQRVNTTLSTASTQTATIPFDNTKPQSGEGTEIMTVTITPLSSTSALVIRALVYVYNSVAADIIAALFRDTGADAKAASVQFLAGGAIGVLALTFSETSGSTSSTTYKLRTGPATASGGTLSINGIAGNARFDGALISSIEVLEIAA